MDTVRKREEKSNTVTRNGVTVNSPTVHVQGAGAAALVGCSIHTGDLRDTKFTAIRVTNYLCTHDKCEVDGPIRMQTRKAPGISKDKARAIGKTFVETKAFREAKRALLTRDFLTIVGAPGEGKTTIALKLALEHSDHNVYHFKSLSELDLSDIREREKPTFVILDNLFGNVSLSRSDLARWQVVVSEFEELLLRKDAVSEPVSPIGGPPQNALTVDRQVSQGPDESTRENSEMSVSQMMKQVSMALNCVASTDDVGLSDVPMSPLPTEEDSSPKMEGEIKGSATLVLSKPSPHAQQEIQPADQMEDLDVVEEGSFFGNAPPNLPPDLKVLFLTRNYVYHEAVKHIGMPMYTLFREESVLDLSKTGLTREDRLALLRRYTRAQPLSKETEAAVLAMKTPMGFPLCCDLYKMEAKFREQPEKFFSSPLAMLQATLGQLLASDSQVKMSLILLLLCDGSLDLVKITNSKLRHESGLDSLLRKMEPLNDSSAIQPEQIRESLMNLQSSYVRMEGEIVSFSHDSVLDAVTFNLGKDHPMFFLEHCSMDLIAKRVQVQDDPFQFMSPTQGDMYTFVIALSFSHIPVLVHRILQEMRQGNLREAAACGVLCQPAFVRVFVQELRKVEDGMSLLHCKDNRLQRYLLFWLSFMQSDASLCEKLLSMDYFPDTEVYQGIFGACLSDQAQFLQPLLENLSHQGRKTVLNTTVTEILKTETPEEGFAGDTVVHVVSQFGNMQALQKLKKLLPEKSWKQGFNRPGAYQWTPMMYACATGHKEIVQFLLSEGADSRSKSESGNSGIHIASLHGQVDVLRCLVAHGDPCDLLGASSCTPLMYACGRGHGDAAQYLLQLGKDLPMETSSNHNEPLPSGEDGCLPPSALATGGDSSCVDINRRDDGGCTALMWSCKLGHWNMAELLLQHGADPTLADTGEGSCLHAASSAGDVKTVSILLEHSMSVNVEDSRGWTPLHCAVHMSRPAVVKALLDSGADPSKKTADGHSTVALAIRSGEVVTLDLLERSGYSLDLCDPQENWSLLHHCCKEGHKQMAEWLWRRCQWTVEDSAEAGAALVAACRHGWLDMVQALVQAGVDVDIESGNCPPIIAATLGGHLAVVQYLLDHRADPGACDDEGNASIHVACMAGCLSILRCLLDHDVDINGQGYEGITPLLYASYTGQLPLVACLLDRGADTSLTVPATNATSLHVASHAGHARVVRKLLDSGVPVNCQTFKGLTPYDLALKAGHMEVCKLLLEHGAQGSSALGMAV